MCNKILAKERNTSFSTSFFMQRRWIPEKQTHESREDDGIPVHYYVNILTREEGGGGRHELET